MLTRSDYSFLKPSEKAAQNFRRLQQANIVAYALLAVLVLLGIWNIIALSSLMRSDTATDLADVSSIRGHISSQLITALALITLAFFIFKEWKWGERSFSMVYFLAPLFFLAVVPVMSAEVEPAEDGMVVKFTLNACEPGIIENGQVMDSSLCSLADLADTSVYMTHADPMEGDPEWHAPDMRDSFGSGWNVEARGRFRVYFLLEQNSMDQCTSAQIATSVFAQSRQEQNCLERDGQAWLVQPYETSTVEGGRLIVYQEVAP